VIKSNVRDLLEMPGCLETCIFPSLGFLMLQLASYTSIAFLLLAIVDVIFQKYEHAKGLRMTKDEIKREFKDTEGNPEIKGKRKSIHREITMNDDIPKAVKRSSVVISNPTHIAVALAYDGRSYKVPQILAMGEDLLAKRIKEIAKENDIPVLENVPLARALFSQGEAGAPIPRSLFRAVAEVLRAVRQIQREASGAQDDDKDVPSAF
jgi:type III secretion protein U